MEKVSIFVFAKNKKRNNLEWYDFLVGLFCEAVFLTKHFRSNG